ncbi:MAG: OmpA family protein [Leptolyngbyaceae bacterium]|nr:OmpA family protein [Leptolyngbyaceae bacterium]
MTGLMMIFMLITAVYIMRVEKTTTLVVDEYREVRNQMYLALQNEFSKDLKAWNADLLGDMTIRFNNPDVQFSTGSDELKPEFKSLIADFFPRYIKIIQSQKFRAAVKEIRIEGHTSRFWSGAVDESDAYFKNMELSQRRTTSTLRYIMSLPVFKSDEQWFRSHITANGLSYSSPRIQNPKTPEQDKANQRVEFKVVTNAADRIEKMISLQAE